MFEPYGTLLVRSNMNASIRDNFDFSSQKPMRRHFVSGFLRAILSLSQEKSSGVKIVIHTDDDQTYTVSAEIHVYHSVKLITVLIFF